MNRSHFSVQFVFAIIVLFYAPISAQSIDIPFLAGRVNDTAGMLSSQTAIELEALLKTHEDSTSNQVAVLTITFLGGADLEEYSMKVAETWKLGQADKDNGVLLLIVRDDRMVRIEVGSGLEGDLPDITCGHIIRNQIVPRFKDGDYNAGIRAGVESILAAIAGAYVAEGESNSSALPDFVGLLIFFAIFLLVVGTFTLIATVTSGFGGWFLYFFLMPFWIAFPSAGFGTAVGGTLFGLYAFGIGATKIWLSKSKKGKEMMKKWSKKWPAAKGGSMRGGSSRGWSSGGSSGGGFSGGGGSFSGGGASGKW